MTDDIQEYLSKFYKRLYDTLKVKGKLKADSVLASFLNLKSNVRYAILDASSLRESIVPQNILSDLGRLELVRLTDKVGYYTITARGVWAVETDKQLGKLDTILSELDEKFFDPYQEAKPLTEKEKAIILTLIGVRAYSKGAAIDLKRGDRALDVLAALLEDSYDLLAAHKVMKSLRKGDLFGKRGNEHPVSHLIRHTDALPKKTRGIYKAPGDQKYFLDLSKDSEVSASDLGYLLWLVYADGLTHDIEADLVRFCNEKAYETSIHLFDIGAEHFAKPPYDNVLKKAVDEYFISHSKW